MDRDYTVKITGAYIKRAMRQAKGVHLGLDGYGSTLKARDALPRSNKEVQASYDFLVSCDESAARGISSEVLKPLVEEYHDIAIPTGALIAAAIILKVNHYKGAGPDSEIRVTKRSAKEIVSGKRRILAELPDW